MKLAYSNWHKELVHDDAIRSEMDSITGGALEFSNTPFIKHRPAVIERDDYRGNTTGRRSFGSRNNGPRDNRNSGPRNSGGRDNRNPRDSRGNGFKKRFK